MVIAHVIDSMEVGGAEAVVAALCRSQRNDGHEPAVHCLHHLGALGEQLKREGFSVWVHGPSTTMTMLRRLVSAFRSSRPAVVHCHNKSATVHAALPARLAGVRALVSTRHGMASPPYSIRRELKFWVVAMLFCDRVVAVCETARRNMIAGAGRAARNVVTIRNGAARAAISGGVSRPPGFVLVTVGRLVPAKNYPLLLESLAMARAGTPDLFVRIVGDGPDASSLKQQATNLHVSDMVEFCGERADVGSFLENADAFVLSSASEGLPISVLEAMAAGLPVIATAVGGIPEVLELSKSGTIVPPGDARALADAIVDFANRRSELAELSVRARDCYAHSFAPERMAADYMSLYLACLDNAAPAGTGSPSAMSSARR